MMIIINAWKSLTRSKGRNSLIGIIILAITLSASVALAIKSTANKAKTSGLDSQTVTGTISVDRQKLMEGSQSTSDSSSDNKRPDMSKMQELMAQYPDLSLDDLQKYADSDYVKNFYFTASAALNGTDTFEPYSTSTSTTSSSETSTESADQRGPGMPGSEGGSGDQSKGQSMGGLSTGDFSVTAASDESALSDFVSGTSKVSDGEMIDLTQSNNEILISKDLADFNNLKVGDTVTLTNPNLETETYSFKIKGIYTTSSSTTDSGFMQFSNAQDPANMIYMSYDTLEAITKTSTDSATTSTDDQGNETTTALTHNISGTFVFSSQKNYEKFESELREKGLSDYYTLSSSDVDSYESSLVPLENLSQFATTFLYVILAVGAVILVVLNIFNIRERKYEIGVLTAIGIKKWKVALQFVVESLIITLAAVIVGASVGSIISVPISNNLLQFQIESQESEQSQQQTNFGRPGDAGEGNAEQGGNRGGGPSGMGSAQTATADYLDSINATLDIKILGQLIGIGLLLTILSSLVGIVFVLRYDPLKILSSRS